MAESYQAFRPDIPNVDVRLFGEAEETGAKLGQEIPNPITSLIQGGEAGYKQGLDFARESAQTEQIKQQTENEKTQNEIQQKVLETSTQLEGAKTKTALAQLDDTYTKATQDNQQKTAEANFLTKYQATSPDKQFGLITDPSNQGIFAKNPTLFKNVLSEQLLNPASAPYQDQINSALGKAKVDSYYQQEAQKQLPKFLEAREEVLNGKGQALTSLISNTLQVPRENAVDSVEMVPTGSVKVNGETGRVEVDPETGKRVVPTAVEQSLAPKNTYTVISKVKGSEGQVLQEGVSKDQYDLYNNYVSQRGLQTGLQKEYALQQLARQQGTPKKDIFPSTGIPTFDRNSATLARTIPQAEDPFKLAIKKDLGVSDSDLEGADQSLTRFQTQLRSYVSTPSKRTDPAFLKDLGTSVQTIARSITDKQFNDNPAIQAQYTQSHVDAYNESLDASIGAGYNAGLPDFLHAKLQQVINAFKVSTPQDLYFVNKRGPIETQLSNVVTSTMALTNQRASFVASSTASKQQANSFLTAVSNGRPTE